MGCRVTENRILLLDGYHIKRSGKHQNGLAWMLHDLNEATLEIEKFRKMGYPLISDGLAVALEEGNQLLMASYGKPPLGAILLRPKGGWLKYIGQSSEDTVKALNVQDKDVVVVGSLDKIS